TSIPTPFVEVTNHPNGLSEQGDRLVSQNTVVIAAEKPSAEPNINTPTLKAYPNPGKTATKFFVSMPLNSTIKVKLYTLSGQLLTTIFEGNSERIAHGISFSTERLSAGVYVAALYSLKGEEARIRLSVVK
ncbi:MAG: T9SS type A sorting domain-containing protein, partial [Fibrobacteres bacterium]|nr:T9SS type A sorting domain-containing protein [Fibrobacterota bacterium]